MGRGLTLDTGALIALERRQARMSNVFAAAVRNRRRITVPPGKTIPPGLPLRVVAATHL